MRGTFAVCLLTLALATTACGGGERMAYPDTTFDQASARVVYPSGRHGGTLRYVMTDAPVSLDPGDIGFAYGADLARLYARSLVTYAPAPGAAGLRVVPDLAESLGRPGDHGRTWTYRLRSGLTYEDGTPVHARDVKYAVARSDYTAELTDGPHRLKELLKGTYWGPYLDKNLDHFTGVTTPDDRTVVFHLKKPFAEFDDVAASPQTAPVPRSADTRRDYEKHPLSTGPYRFAHHTVGKDFTLVRNEHWKDDPSRAALPDRIEVTEKVAAADVDARLLDGRADADPTGAGVLPATRVTILADPARRVRADDPLTGLEHYAMLPTGVKPFEDPHCRRAVTYAVDRDAVRAAYGGPAAGDIATGVLPPTVTGYRKNSPPSRDLSRARAELRACGHPDGFTTVIAARADRGGDVAAAQAIQRSLADIGVTARITKPSAFAWGDTAQSPSYVHTHGLGVVVDSWAGDRPTGGGFLEALTAPATKVNNHNVMELDDRAVTRAMDRARTATDPGGRARLWADADQAIMNSGAFVPLVAERTVIYRPATLANAYVHPAYGTYDLAALGRR